MTTGSSKTFLNPSRGELAVNELSRSTVLEMSSALLETDVPVCIQSLEFESTLPLCGTVVVSSILIEFKQQLLPSFEKKYSVNRMTHCNRGRELLVNLQRAEWLPHYDEEGVRSILKEMNEMWRVQASLQSRSEDLDSEAASVYFSQCLDRNKRYMLSYHLHRLEKIRELRWKTGAVLHDEVRERLSTSEIEYFSSYNNILSDYNLSLGVDLSNDVEVSCEYLNSAP